MSRYAGPIYPVPVKPPSSIRRWSDWPEDVEPVLRDWNRHGRLSFFGSRVFKCWRCGLFCHGQMYGTCQVKIGKSNGRRRYAPHCDDCMIALAREAP